MRGGLLKISISPDSLRLTSGRGETPKVPLRRDAKKRERRKSPVADADRGFGGYQDIVALPVKQFFSGRQMSTEALEVFCWFD